MTHSRWVKYLLLIESFSSINITTWNVKVSSTSALLDGGRTGKCRTDTLQVAERRKKCWFLDVTASLALELRYFSGQDACFVWSRYFLIKMQKNIFPSFLLHFYHFSQLRLSILVTSRLRSSVVGKSLFSISSKSSQLLSSVFHHIDIHALPNILFECQST